MNSNYFCEYASLLERILSTGYKYKFSSKNIERRISYNPFFQSIETNDNLFSLFIEEDKLINNIYNEINVDLKEVPVYKQCAWAAEAYLRIQIETGLTFETIFLYVSLNEMYEYYDLYHEMDFNQIVDLFNQKYNKFSTLALLLNKYQFQLSDISLKSSIPYDTLNSLKIRRRDIKKVNVEMISKLARLLNVRIETISELRLNQK